MAHGHDRKYKEDEHVTCPFYKRESDIEIKCEGIVSDVLSNRFKTVQQKNCIRRSRKKKAAKAGAPEPQAPEIQIPQYQQPQQQAPSQMSPEEKEQFEQWKQFQEFKKMQEKMKNNNQG